MVLITQGWFPEEKAMVKKKRLKNRELIDNNFFFK
jgi:hypothetical protein